MSSVTRWVSPGIDDDILRVTGWGGAQNFALVAHRAGGRRIGAVALLAASPGSLGQLVHLRSAATLRPVSARWSSS